MRRQKRAAVRRGVLLLVVLAILAMFAMMAIAFVVICNHRKQGALAASRAERVYDPPDRLLNQAAWEVFRGTNNGRSALRHHSLLEDIYGNDSVLGTITDVPTPVAGGQLLEIAVPDLPHRMGCVLTMLSGKAASRSTRIVGFGPSTGKAQILAFSDGAMPAPGDRYLINGVPFSGTGAGLNSSSSSPAILDARDPNGWPYALLPNPAAFEPNPAVGYVDPAGPGDVNEDYDAADYQNMLVAVQMPDGSVPIPSLHRPELVRYWMRREPAKWNDPDPAIRAALRRKVILRPLAEDNPRFTGSNPDFDPLHPGTWDVDNDGDARPDSIWVDLGQPVRFTADGRAYKPLFAILCVDLDGRLNLNAHGCLAQTTDGYYSGATVPDIATLQFAGTSKPTDRLPLLRGCGWGVAEINLAALFATGGATSHNVEYRRLLTGTLAMQGNHAILLDGRYGESNLLAAGRLPPGPGFTCLDFPQPGPFIPFADRLSFNKHFDYPDNFYNFSTLTSYGAPPDLKGSAAIGVDLGGQPLCQMLADPAVGNSTSPCVLAGTNHPYELNLSQTTGRGQSSPARVDNPFSVSELERLLRPHDIDAALLPSRLLDLVPSLADKRSTVTTESYDLPCPNVVLPKSLRRGAGQPKRATHLVDLLRAKGVDVSDLRRIALLLPQEFLAGLRLDLNRPFGNGRDDNGNGVVDEPGDAPPQGPEMLRQVKYDGSPDNWPCDVNNNGLATQDSLTARQRYARSLYVLMMLLADDKALPSWASLDWDAARKREEHARWIAQWAVNVVDFRDRDSILTRFDYDPTPFANGGRWQPPQDGRHTVWGCERPELLITETWALHDRRTEDLDTEEFDPAEKTADHTEAGRTTDAAPKQDSTFDQRLKPEGSLFVELFNPWLNHYRPMVEPPPAELYSQDPDTGNWGLDLTRTASRDGVISPVWRIVIAMGPDTGADLDDPFGLPPPIDRVIYFVKRTAGGDVTMPPGGNVRFYPSPNYQAKLSPVLGGQYALLGPDSGDSGTAITYLGFRTDANPKAGSAQTRQIVLQPGASPAVEVRNNGNRFSEWPGDARPPLAIVINRGTGADNRTRRLSVSEPVEGYPDKDPDGKEYDPADGYTLPYDVPLDKRLNQAVWESTLKNTGTYANFCTVYLQRLANPLRPHDATANPYRTVDKMPVDLTACNGVTSGFDPDDEGDSAGDEDGPDDEEDDPAKLRFSTRERGQLPKSGPNNIWRQESPDGSPWEHQDTATDHVFRFNLQHTFGYLNRAFGDRLAGPERYVGCPADAPFPWLTWLNRPLASNLELLLVPSTRPSELLGLYGTRPASPDPYTGLAVPHLMNFFLSEAGFCRFLDLVHVPSRFANTELMGSPQAFSESVPPGFLPSHHFHPPFNRISRYREPGRVNLNTIYDRDVFRALLNRPDLGDGGLWDKFVKSRQGPGEPGQYPTSFAQPFRSPASFDLVPIPELASVIGSEVDCTILRQGPGGPGQPLFEFYSTDPANTADSSPYIRYQYLERLGNMVTTRSNVYAVWITVGYFEVEPAANPAIHPDGCQLGMELGIDTGEVQRHRAFFIFDRSIPVGFQRGKDLNVEKAILLRRCIE